MSLARVLIGVMGLTIAIPAAHAQGRLIPSPCVAPRPGVSELCRPLAPSIVHTRSDVRAELVGQVLRFEVEDRFLNRGSTVGEADYLFPLPGGAAFDNLALVIDGELVAGETMNATDARRIYEEIVRRQRDPALVEWIGSGLLRTRVFPINPGEEKRVVVRYQSVARREGDAIRVDWFGARTGSATDVRLTQPTGASATRLTFTYPNTPLYGRAYSPTHEIDVAERGTTRTVTVNGSGGDVTVLIPVRRAAEPSIAALAYAPAGEDGFALITVSPPSADDRADATTPRDITLVLDVSGSMQGTKMTQARAAARQLLATLTPRDRFRIIDFGTDVNFFPETAGPELAAATPANLRAAREYVDRLEAVGSTNIAGALREAARTPVDPARLPLVLFITDGEPTVGERDPVALVNIVRPAGGDPGRAPRRIFTFGVGADVNVSLLEQLALEGAGTSQFVRPDESVERALGVVASRLVDPVLTNVQVRTEGGVRLSRVLPPRGTDLFAGQDLVVLARYSGNGPSRIIVEGTRRGTPVRWTQEVDLPARERGNLFVARLWATQRVGYLAADKRRNGGSPELDAEIRELGERYGIPTEFTSYFVREPGMVLPQMDAMGAVGGVRRGGAGGGGGRGGSVMGVGAAPPAAAPVRTEQFEAARLAADLRATQSVANMAKAAESRMGDASGLPTRIVDGRTFMQKDSVWTDVRMRAGLRTVTVRPYSAAWFDLVARLPELKGAFALGDRVVIAGRQVAIAVAPTGVERLDAATVAALTRDW